MDDIEDGQIVDNNSETESTTKRATELSKEKYKTLKEERKKIRYEWKNLLKKERSKKKRQMIATAKGVSEYDIDDNLLAEVDTDSDFLDEEERKLKEKEHKILLERERISQLEWAAKKEKEEYEKTRRDEIERRIQFEWEAKQKLDLLNMKKKKKGHKSNKNNDSEEDGGFINKQEKESFNEEKKSNDLKPDKIDLKPNTNVPYTNSLDAAWRNPTSHDMVYSSQNMCDRLQLEANKCNYYWKTGVCRFGNRCSRFHPRVEHSNTLIFHNMYYHFELEQGLFDEDYNQDLTMEYEYSEIYKHFKQFYLDTLPEFKLAGRVLQFKVCCNYESHLRGNVYVQYDRLEDAISSYNRFNGRWYAGRQLSCEFSHVCRWRYAICSGFKRGECIRGKRCNYLHPFRNPNDEFYEADKDFMITPPRPDPYRSPINIVKEKRSISRSRRSYTRDRSRRRNRSYSRGRSRSRRRKSYSRSTSKTWSTSSSRSRSRSKSKHKKKSKSKRSRHYSSYSSCSRSSSRSSQKKSKEKPKNKTSSEKVDENIIPSVNENVIAESVRDSIEKEIDKNLEAPLYSPEAIKGNDELESCTNSQTAIITSLGEKESNKIDDTKIIPSEDFEKQPIDIFSIESNLDKKENEKQSSLKTADVPQENLNKDDNLENDVHNKLDYGLDDNNKEKSPLLSDYENWVEKQEIEKLKSRSNSRSRSRSSRSKHRSSRSRTRSSSYSSRTYSRSRTRSRTKTPKRWPHDQYNKMREKEKQFGRTEWKSKLIEKKGRKKLQDEDANKQNTVQSSGWEVKRPQNIYINRHFKNPYKQHLPNRQNNKIPFMQPVPHANYNFRDNNYDVPYNRYDKRRPFNYKHRRRDYISEDVDETLKKREMERIVKEQLLKLGLAKKVNKKHKKYIDSDDETVIVHYSQKTKTRKTTRRTNKKKKKSKINDDIEVIEIDSSDSSSQRNSKEKLGKKQCDDNEIIEISSTSSSTSSTSSSSSSSSSSLKTPANNKDKITSFDTKRRVVAMPKIKTEKDDKNDVRRIIKMNNDNVTPKWETTSNRIVKF